MKRNIKWGLLGLSLFFAVPSFSQDSLVRIKPSTARYYLEKEDEVYLLREKDSISNELIYNLSSEIHLKDLIIQSFQSDTLIHQKREEALKQNIQWAERDRDLAEHKLDGVRFVNTILLGATGGAFIGSTIPVIGTALGAVGGAAIGTVVALTKRRN